MMIIARPPHLECIVIPWVLMAVPAAAQHALDARMRAFTRAVTAEAFVDSAAAFFPRRGEWTWTLTIHRGPRGDSIVVRRFRAEQTLEAIREGGIACESFAPRFEVRTIGPLIDRMLRDERPWRRVRGNRFVPRGASAGSPVFVDWRREDGRWVIDGYGDEVWRRPRLLGRARNEGTRDSLPGPPLTTPVPADGPHAGRRRWYLEHEPICSMENTSSSTVSRAPSRPAT
ncbi:MAG TPA: hypothetical protein VHG93_06495 [Longimicrobium sp.]|nr:hypothetical protein [Longimicrobium sp.]